MKKTIPVLLLLAFLQSCVSTAARENVLLPAMRIAFSGISEEIEAGLNDAHAKEEITAVELGRLLNLRDAFADGLKAGEASLVPVENWATLKIYADRGIRVMVAAGDMEEAALPIVTARRLQFEAAVTVLLQFNAPISGLPARIPLAA